MKADNLKLFFCPNCKNDNLKLSAGAKNNVEITQGNILCENCRKKYIIEDGIAELILPVEDIINEEKFYLNELNSSIKNDGTFIENKEEFILALPNITGKLSNRPHVINYFVTQGINFYFVLDKLKPKKRDLVLDIGAGRCWTSAEFARRGCGVFAIEILKEKYLGLKTAQIYIDKENIFFERTRADMTNLPFKNKTFDIVFFNCSIHHSYNINKSVSEAARVLKDGGKLVLLNEPVKGFFRKHKDLDELKESGLNENSYFIGEYEKILSKYNIKFNTFFPASFDIKLKSMAKNGGFFNKIVGFSYIYFFSKIIDLKIIKKILHRVFGMGLNLIGVKTK